MDRFAVVRTFYDLVKAARDLSGSLGDPAAKTQYVLNAIDEGAYNINDSDPWGNSLLIACALGEQLHSSNLLYKIWPQHVVLARALLDRGADVNQRTTSVLGIAPDGSTALAVAAAGGGLASPDLVALLLDAGADVDMMNARGTPLANAIKGFGDVPDDPPRHHACRKIVHILLRAGAQTGTLAIADEVFERTEDRCFRGEIGIGSPRAFYCSAESHAHYTAAKEMILGVRAAGSWRAYAKLPRKQVLSLRSLALRGRAEPRDARMTFLVESPNEIAWKVLEYWRTELDC